MNMRSQPNRLTPKAARAVERTVALTTAVLLGLAALHSAFSPPATTAQPAQVRLYLPLLMRGASFLAFPPTAVPTRPPNSPTATAGPTPTALAGSPTVTAPPTVSGTATATASATPATAEATPTGSGTATTTPGPGTLSPTPTPTANETTPTPPWTPTPGTETATPSPEGSATATATAVATSSATVSPADSSNVFGVQIFGTETGLPAILDQVDEAGTRWVRLLFEWRWIETVQGQRNWAFWDGVLADLDRRGFEVIAVVMRHPTWLPAPTTACFLAPPHLPAYRDFLTAAAERYDGDGVEDAPGSPRIGYWEIGNEPDFTPSRAAGEGDYGSCFGDDPAAYARTLATAFEALTAAAPQAQVVFGAVAYDRFYDKADYLSQHRGPFRYSFVRDVLAASCPTGGEGAWPPFHVMALHSYNDFRDNWDGPAGTLPELVGKAEHLRANQLTSVCGRDLSGLPLLVSEVSLSSAPSNRYIRRTEEYQAAYVGRVMARTLAARALAAIWYVAEDYPGTDCSNPDSWQLFGLLRSLRVMERAAACPANPLPGYQPAADHEPKPAMGAYRTAVAALAGARYERQLSASETGRAEAEAHLLRLADGQAALVAFTDHGAPLGKITGGVPVPDIEHDLVVGPALLPGWTGRLEITDMTGRREIRSGATITVRLSYRPQYLRVVP